MRPPIVFWHKFWRWIVSQKQSQESARTRRRVSLLDPETLYDTAPRAMNYRRPSPGVERLECRLAPAVVASISGGVLTIVGTTGAEDISIQLQSNDATKLQVFEGSTQVANSPFTVSSFTSVTIDGNGGTDTFTVSDLTANVSMASMTVTINGGNGADTYKLGDNWGTVVINDTGGALDFNPQFSGSLTVNTPSDAPGQHEIVGNNGGTISTLNFPASATFSTDVSGISNKTNLQAGLNAVANLADRMEAVGKLGTGLFLFDGQPLGQIVDLGGMLRAKLVDPIAALGASPTLDQVLAAWNNAGGVQAAANRASNGDTTYTLTLDIQQTAAGILLALPDEFAEKLQIDAVKGDVSTRLQWTVQVTQTNGGAFSASSVTAMQVSADLSKTGFDGRAGFLGLNFGNPSVIFLNADIAIDTSSLSSLTTAQINALSANGLNQTGTALAKYDFTGTTTVGGVSIAFPSLPAPQIRLTGSSTGSTFDLFNPNASRTYFDNYSAAGLSDFFLTTASSVYSQLSGLTDLLGTFSDKALDAGLPLSASGKTLADILKLKNSYQTSFITPLQQQALTNATLVSSLNRGRGVRTAAGDDIRVTLSNGVTFTVELNANAAATSLDPTTTIGDLIARIQAKASATGGINAGNFEVRIDPRTGGIALVDRTGGSGTFSVQALSSSLAAADLEMLTTGSITFDEDTLLRDLNGGVGVRTKPGQNDIRVTLSVAAKSFDVNLDHGANATIRDLIKKIQDASGLTRQDLEVILDKTNLRLTIIDHTGGGSVPANVTALNSSSSLGDLKINATSGGMAGPNIVAQNIGYPGPNFATIQELVSKAGGQVTALAYDSATHKLSFTADIDLGQATSDALALFDMGPLKQLQVTNGATVTLTPAARSVLHMPFEMILTPVGAGFNLGSGNTSSMPLSGLNRGMGVRTATGADLHVQLSDNSKSFDVDLDNDPSAITLASLGISNVTGDDLTVTLKDGTSFGIELGAIGTQTIADLVTKANAAAVTAFGIDQVKFLARVDVGRGSLLFIDRSTGNGTMLVAAPGLGMGSATRAVLGSDLETFAEATFFTLGDVMQKIQQAASNAGLTAAQFELRVSDDGKGLVAIDGTAGPGDFEIQALNDSIANRDLGFLTTGSEPQLENSTLLSSLRRGAGVRTAAGNDFRVTLRDGSFFDVDLSGSQTTIGDVMAAIDAAANSAFGGGQSKFRTGLDPVSNKPALFDLTSGGTAFAITSLNSSNAAADLGITASGVAGNMQDGTAAYVVPVSSTTRLIQGAPLHGDTITSHFGVRNATIQSTVNLSASNIAATGVWNLAAIGIAGGSATGSFTFDMTFADPGTDAADGFVSLSELRSGLADVNTLVSNPVRTGTLTLDLPVTLTPGFGGLSSTATAHVVYADVTDTTTPPVVTFPSNNATADFLAAAQSVTMADALGALSNAAAYLQSLQSASQIGGQVNPLAQPILGLYRTPGQLLRFAETFSALIASLQANPPTTLQALQTALAALPNFGSVSLGFDTTAGSPALKINLTYSPQQISSQRLQLNLPKTSAELTALDLSSASTILDADRSSPVTVTANATLALGIGINLTGARESFLYGDETIADVDIRAIRDDLNFDALLGARTVSILAGSYVFDSDGSGASTTPANYSVDLATGRQTFANALTSATGSLTGKVNATLPIQYGPELNQPLKSTISLAVDYPPVEGSVALSVSGPNVDATLASQPLNGNIQGLRAGFKELFRLLDLAFDASVFSKGLPIVGTQLMDAANFLEQIQNKVGDNFDFTTGILTPTRAQQAIFDAFGPGGLNWLQDNNSDGLVNKNDVVITTDANGTSFSLNLSSTLRTVDTPVDFDMMLPGLGLKLQSAANLKLGFSMPLSFGISTTKGVYIHSSSLTGFSINLEADLAAPADSSGYDGWLGNLPYKITQRSGSNARIQGSFAFGIADPNNDGTLTLNEMMSAVGVYASANESAAQTAAQGLIKGGFTSTSNIDFRLHLVSNLPAGTALPRYQMDLDITNWGFASSTSSAVTTQTTPTIAFDHLQFELVSYVKDFVGPALIRMRNAMRPVDGIVDFVNSAAFPFLSLVFGRAPYTSAASFGGKTSIGDFAGASLAIRRMVEGGQLVGKPGNPFGIFGVVPFELMPDTPALGSPAFIQWSKLLATGPISGLTGTAWINLGTPNEIDFTIDGNAAKQPLPSGQQMLAPQNPHMLPYGDPTDGPNVSILGQIRALAADVNSPDGVQDAALTLLATQLLPGRGKIDGLLGGAIRILMGSTPDPIDMPLLTDPAKNIRVLFGDYTMGGQNPQDVTLFSYDTPEMFVYLYKDIPISKEQLAQKIFGVSELAKVFKAFSVEVEAFIPVAFETRADMKFVFDTTGLQSYARTKNPGDIGNGFYFDDLTGVDKNGPNTAKMVGSNKDPAEAHILGGAGIGVQIVFNASILRLTAGVEAIAFLGTSYNLHDPDNSDGLYRVRANEFDVNTGASVYDQGFVVELRADAFVKISIGISIFRITIIDIRFNLGTVTFDIPMPGQVFNSPPAVAGFSNGIVTLNFLNQTADTTYWIGAGPAAGDVVVSAKLKQSFAPVFGISIPDAFYVVSQLFSGVTRVVGNAGAGNDTLYVSSAVTTTIEYHGGGGNDTIYGGSGNDFLYGDAGTDAIFGGAGADEIHGGTEVDTIEGGDGNDLVYGDAGADTLRGGRGDDTIYGGIGANFIYGGMGADLLIGDQDDEEFYGNQGNDIVRAGGGNDRVYGGDGADELDGEEGNDTIYGGLGNDLIHGSDGVDQIYGEQHNDTIYGGLANDRLDGGGASDRVFGDNGPPDSSDAGGDDLIFGRDGSDFLDGQGGSDVYLIDFFGVGADSLITVLDTGSAVGTDLFTATGTIFADQFLLRSDAGGALSFVAMLNGPTAVERINYSGVERIVVNGGLGDDSFAVDDTAAEITINGEEGRDTFQIGQLYSAPRTPVDANVSVDDAFATIQTTRGFLSNGVSRPMTANGGTGNDHFVVFHNKAELALNGDDGDDMFEIRAFALVGSQEPQRARTDISGGAGADLVEYAINAPVNVDGGDGFDTIVIIGTEFGDDFAITKEGVYGAGLTVRYTNVESLRVDGAEGDDRFYIQSTSEKVATEILGGLGNDTFNVSGDVPPVTSNDLKGHSGLILQGVESQDARFNGQNIWGVAAHVADNDEPAVVIRPTNGATIITEGGVADTYTVVLAFAPITAILVKALAPIPTPNEREKRARKFSVSSNAPGAQNAADGTFVTLRFTPSNWFIPQNVFVAAGSTTYTDAAGLSTRPELGDSPTFSYDDSAYEGIDFGTVSHVVVADLPSYNGSLSQSQLSAVTGATQAVLQVGGSPATGDQFHITINNNTPVSFTAGADASFGAILDGLRTAFLATQPAQGGIAATRISDRVITVSGNINAGDQYTVTIGTKTLTYSVPQTGVRTVAQMASGIAQLINAANLTGVSADPRANNGTLILRTLASSSVSVAELTDPGNNTAISLGSATQLLILDADDGNLATDNSTNFTVSKISANGTIGINVDGANGATMNVAVPDKLSLDLVGRKIAVTSGPGAGQQRYVVSVIGSVVTVDRPWDIIDTPTFQSTYQIRMDDAIVGQPSAINNTNFTLTDASRTVAFRTAGEGLRGRVVRIVGGPGVGQERLILSNTSNTLTLNGPWSVAPTSASIYRIDMFDGLAVPSLRVQVNDNDLPGVIVDETHGYQNGVTPDNDNLTTVIEGGNGDQFGEMDAVRLRLSKDPGATPVDVTLTYDGTQLTLTDVNGNAIAGNKLTFTSANWNMFQVVRVAAFNDTIREGFHSSLISFTVTAGSADATVTGQTDSFTIPADNPVFFMGLTQTPSGSISVTLDGQTVPQGPNPTGLSWTLVGSRLLFNDSNDPAAVSGALVVTYNYVNPGFLSSFTPPVLVKINDDDAPTVLTRETAGSTDVIENSGIAGAKLTALAAGWTAASLGVVGERDRYSVTLIAGRTYTFEMRGAPSGEGTLSDPLLRLYDAADPNNVITSNDDNGSLNSRIVYTPTVSATYLLEAGAYLDGLTGTYVITALPGSFTGTLGASGERDRYGVSLVAGRTYTFDLRGLYTGDGTLRDPYLRLFAASAPSTLVTYDDDSGGNLNSRIVFTPSTSGLYFLEAGAYADYYTGTYTLSWTDDTNALTAADVQGLQGANDSYSVVLTGAPEAGKTVSVTITPAMTKTTRTGGIRHDAVQVAISSTDSRVTANSDGTLTVVFNDQNWDQPVNVKVSAIDDTFVDGGDTKVFAPGPHAVSSILGPLTLDGGGGAGSLVGLPAPVLLPGETNVKPKTGDVFVVSGTQVTVFAADLQSVLGANSVGQLVGRTLQITAVTPATNRTHSAIGQFRQIVSAVLNGNGTATLTLNRGFDYNLGTNTSESDADLRSYAITNESANFFVNELTQVDTMYVHDEDSPADSFGMLTSNRLTGLGMGPDITIGSQKYLPGGVMFGNLEVVDITLGRGFNNFTVLGTPTRSDGYQTWTTIRTGDDVYDPNQPNRRVGDTVTVKVNATQTVSATGNATSGANPTRTAFATLVDSGANFATATGGLAGQLVEIVSGFGAGQQRRILGNTATTLSVDRPWETIPDATSVYRVVKEADGKLSIDLGAGDDVLDATGSTLGIVAFGGLGQDQITGGSGDDILFGDRGRVDFSNGSGAIVTRLGYAPQPIIGGLTTQVAAGSLTTLVDSSASFPVPTADDTGLRGLYVWINNGRGFMQAPQLIVDNTATTLTLSPGFSTAIDLPGPGGADASQYRISTYPENQTDGVIRGPNVLTTVDDSLGANDVISAGAGNNQVFGGAGSDTITTGSGNDTILGDAGRIDRLPDPAATVDVFTGGQNAPAVPTLQARVRSKSFANGAADDITAGDGADLIIGGAGDDTIRAGEGANLVFGDDGQVINAWRAFGATVSTPGADLDATDIDLIESLSTTANGGVDTITAGTGNNIIVGGRFGDSITTGTGANLVVGDSGRITASNANGVNQMAGQPITLGLIETIAFADGGVDTITTGSGGDIVLGGFGGDTLNVGDGNNLILGDDGQIDFTRADRLPNAIGADNDPTDIDLIESLSPTAFGGADQITAGIGNDIILGGRLGDTIDAGNGSDIVFGDSARLTGNDTPAPFALSGQPLRLGKIETMQPDDGGDDLITAGAGADVVFGGFGADTLTLGLGDDIALGDNGELAFVGGVPVLKTTDTATTTGAADVIVGNDGDDAILGGVGADVIDGNVGNDLILGDNGTLTGRVGGIVTDPRNRALLGTTLYDASGQVRIDRTQQFASPGTAPAWANWVVTLDAGLTGLYGDDYIAGGPDNDTIFGQRGNDTIQGDGSIDSRLLSTPQLVGAYRDVNGLLVVAPSVEAVSDGDDYIEGGDGTDTVFGNLGQDDIIGGNSNQFGLTTTAQRSDGADMLFGGAGVDIARNDAGDTAANGHARDADTIVGDNGNIFRLVGTNGVGGSGFLTFNYDNYNQGSGSANKIIPRAVELIDYTPGGPSFNVLALNDVGGGDEIHGESGDDTVYGMTGVDRLFGDGQDDDLIGGWGADWINGGAGDDGVLGDDGRLWSSRNGLAEPLYGLAAIPANQLNQTVTTSTRQNQALINISGELRKTADLEPTLYGGNDIVYGGLGNDFLHGGAGDDAMSGAEALPNFFDVAINPGNVLGYGTVRPREFAAYNYFQPRAKVAGFLLNFDASTNGSKLNDGRDAIFGDDGNDWLVGGTDADRMYGGTGGDLLQADDNLDTANGTNTGNELGLYGDADLAFGGGGNDIMIANTTDDRLIDWRLDVNTFVVPFGNATAPTVTSSEEASLYAYLYAVSANDGADPTRVGPGLGSASRNGEPYGELGLFVTSDADYYNQVVSPQSTPSNVNQIILQGVPTLASPTGTVAGDVQTFTWSSVFGATNYEIWIDNVTTGQSQVIRTASITTTSWTSPALSPGNTYAWWVRAISSTGNATAWSTAGRFTIAAIAAPVAIGPTLAQSTDSLNFTWNPVAGAAKYDLWLQDSASGAVVAYRTGLVGASWAAPTLSPGRTYQWWLRSVSANGTTSAWNTPLTFSVPALGTPVLGTPTGLQATETPTFTWTSTTLAVRYDVYLSNNTTGAVQVLSSGNMAGVASPSWTSPALSLGSNYTWWVRAVSANGTVGAWSISKTFSTPSLGTPTLSGPTGAVATDTPTFAWSGVSYAAKYDVYLSNTTTGANQVLRTGNLAGVVNPTFASPALAPGSNYTWWVRAVSADGTLGAWSVSRSFSTPALTVPVLVGPTGNGVSTTPTFNWNTVALAARYDVYVSDLTTGQDQVVRKSTLTGTSWTLTGVPSLISGHRYRWWLRAISNDGTVSAWSNPLDFVVL